ncbi:DNA polymerase domain-containing protein [Microbispora rosea subsp. aerata]|nr:non-homologous end-joining DNA ligase [Microbispora rosea]GGO26830.1 DNA polymerase domain-containing protein [Microbispora rosea subsp. aerata]GIH58425.1 DNA polymerase domain-containing protein [Microbispora rosea subsp. aerata]GLJ87117.1 DNA polymerase domain-containing protein [Microbispora rosea subsp. aerata]
MTLEADGRIVTITHPDRVVFPRTGHTKLDLVSYYRAVAEGAVRGVAGRPVILKRFVHGVEGEAFFQKRAPAKRPGWVEVVELSYPSGRTAEEVVIRDLAHLLWTVNLGCVDLNPHPVRACDLDHPDELRIDLDPVPGVGWEQIVRVALVARDVLEEHGLTAWPKTSGSRGFHVYARIEPRWTFNEVRRAAEAVAREVERREPDVATSRWWKEERHGVFVDYNQNARDHTVASAYSVRPTGLVSAPLTWDEVPGCRPEDFTLASIPGRYAEAGDPWAGMDGRAGSLDALLELADAQGPRPDRPTALPRRGRRQPVMPLIEIARAATRDEAMAGLERWKARHPEAARLLRPADVLVDSMRGRSSTWTRIRVNLRNVPEPDRPGQEPLEVDYDPWAGP